MEREHSLALMIDGRVRIAIDDTDTATIARVFKLLGVYGESIERWGLPNTLRIMEHGPDMKQIAFTEAQGGSGLVSTMVGTSKQ